jgi:hypothetical protein
MALVITVILFIMGLMFVSTTQTEKSAVSGLEEQNTLETGIDAVIDQINTVLVDDLFGVETVLEPELHLLAETTPAGGRPNYTIVDIVNEPWDAAVTDPVIPGIRDDEWLASLEPVCIWNNSTPEPIDDLYAWPHLTDLYGNNFDIAQPPPGMFFYDPESRAELDKNQWDGSPTSEMYKVSPFNFNTLVRITDDNKGTEIIVQAGNWSNPKDVWLWGARADADGDGVADSRWVKVPNITGPQGQNVYTAVRIIDNGGMLNLNTAFSMGGLGDGRYLSSVAYEPFLRGDDRISLTAMDRIRNSRMYNYDASLETEQSYHQNVVMNIENPDPAYVLFDISDELEMRNRYLLTSEAEARFEQEQTAHYTFDADGGLYPALHIPRTLDNFDTWKFRMDPLNFDDSSGGAPTYEWKYDRRHVCTFYSYTRTLGRGRSVAVGGVGYNKLLEQRGWLWPGLNVPVNTNVTLDNLQIAHWLYVLRSYYMESGDPLDVAAKKAAQVVVNLIDYMDRKNTTPGSLDCNPLFVANLNDDGVTTDPAPLRDTDGAIDGLFDGSASPTDPDKWQKNANPTFLNESVIERLIEDKYKIDVDHPDNSSPDPDIRAAAPFPRPEVEFGLDAGVTVYGYEIQPFISELYGEFAVDATGPPATYSSMGFAIELCNPYGEEVELEDWQITIGPAGAGTSYTFNAGDKISAGTPSAPGRLVIENGSVSSAITGASINIGAITITTGDIVQLERPDPANPGSFIVVDKTETAQTSNFNTGSEINTGIYYYTSERCDQEWEFVNAAGHEERGDPFGAPAPTTSTLGSSNSAVSSVEGYQLPVVNNNGMGPATLLDLGKILTIGNESGTGAKTITEQIGSAGSESDIRFDIKTSPQILDYLCFMNRPQGNLPGRININTATREVIRAAIPPSLTWNANDLATEIVSNRPFEKISDLLTYPNSGFAEWGNNGAEDVGDSNVKDDFEERDWILSRIANIFTVRSDVFTAYILVRVGERGPGRRVIAIFDRSNVFLPADRPKLVVLHPVPDPR